MYKRARNMKKRYDSPVGLRRKVFGGGKKHHADKHTLKGHRQQPIQANNVAHNAEEFPEFDVWRTQVFYKEHVPPLDMGVCQFKQHGPRFIMFAQVSNSRVCI